MVYTHTDKDHIHNHVVINSVSYEDGGKFHAHGKKAIDRVREASDRLCQERNLSVIKEPYYERQDSTSYDKFKKKLTQKYGIEVKERGKNISFKHPDADRQPSQQGHERNQEPNASRHQQYDQERTKQNEPIRI